MTIKETAGKVALYLYQLQRTVPSGMRQRQLGFLERKDGGGLALTSDKKWLTKDLLDINPTVADLLNAFMFLRDKRYIQSEERATSAARIYVGIQLTGLGIDIIEGVERDRDGKKAFTETFNIVVDDNVNIERLVKDHLGALMEG